MKALRSTILLVSLLAVVAVSAAPNSRGHGRSDAASAQPAPASQVTAPAHGSGAGSGSPAKTYTPAPAAKSYTPASSPAWGGSQAGSNGRHSSGSGTPTGSFGSGGWQASGGSHNSAPVSKPAPTFTPSAGSWGNGGGSQGNHGATNNWSNGSTTTVHAIPGSGGSPAPRNNNYTFNNNGSFGKGNASAGGQHPSGSVFGHAGPVVSAQPAPHGGDGGFRGGNDRNVRVSEFDRGRGSDHNWGDHSNFRIRFTPRPDFHRPSDWDLPYRGRFSAHWTYFLPTSHVYRIGTSMSLPPLGSTIVASDGTFLGVISTDRNDPDSISNPYGRFGSPESPYSIWNAGGRWGADSSFLSPWTSYANEPPAIYVGSSFWGYLTVNDDVYPRVSPSWLAERLGIPLS